MAFQLIGDVALEACCPAAVVWINVDQVGSHTLQPKEFSATRRVSPWFWSSYMEQYLLIIKMVTVHCLAPVLLSFFSSYGGSGCDVWTSSFVPVRKCTFVQEVAFGVI